VGLQWGKKEGGIAEKEGGRRTVHFRKKKNTSLPPNPEGEGQSKKRSARKKRLNTTEMGSRIAACPRCKGKTSEK